MLDVIKGIGAVVALIAAGTFVLILQALPLAAAIVFVLWLFS